MDRKFRVFAVAGGMQTEVETGAAAQTDHPAHTAFAPGCRVRT